MPFDGFQEDLFSGLTAPRALIACETSGTVRNAFLARGFDAWSCDLLPADDGSNRHIVADVRDLLGAGWNLLMVAHPPCTRLCRSGQRWLYGPGKTHPKKLPKGRTWASMIAEFEEGCDLFQACLDAPIERKCLENPEMNIHARERLVGLPKPQMVQPWMFGHRAFKNTGLYIRGLPELEPDGALTPPLRGTDEYKAWAVIHRASPGPDRWKIRSKFWPGIARAMADQWGRYCLDQMQRQAA